MSKLRALIFDVDGTLGDTERHGHRVAFNRAFAAAGLDWNWSVSFYGKLLAIPGGKERLHFYINKYHPDFRRREDLEQFILHLHESKNEYYRQILATEPIPLRPGVRRLLRESLSEGIRLAIASTANLANVLSLLKYSLSPEAPSWFEVIAAGDIVPAKKPAPDIYQYTLEKMGLSPSECLAFEDSPQGLIAAHGAGLKTVVTVNEYTKHYDFPTAILVLDSLGEPDQPFKVLAGNPGMYSYLNLSLAKHL